MIVKGFGENTGAAKEAAFDALLHWNDIEAATPLIDICRDASASDYFTRALAGYVKLASNPAMTGENRMIYLRKALELAKTDAEKRRIISLMGKTGTYFALLCAGEYMNEPALKETSAIAVMNIALDHPEYTGEMDMYVITGLDVSTAKSLSYYMFTDPTCDNLYYDENIDALLEGYTCFAYSSVKGRYDRRADLAKQCIKLSRKGIKPNVRTATIIAIAGDVNADDMFGNP